ncbi:hypothetical protein ABT160_46315, partial [Streptomyces sp. NPDC001941]|uniref:hypothetical protein n=1 Tax=Streptomyces sp. NPDC001941 TaxID=3154659 RepID=UPI00331A1BA1
SWTFKVKLDPNYRGDGSDIGNVATAGSDTPDPNPGNNDSDPAGPPGDRVRDPLSDIEISKTVANG